MLYSPRQPFATHYSGEKSNFLIVREIFLTLHSFSKINKFLWLAHQDIRNGLCLNLNGDIYTIVEFLHVNPGKGNAFVRTKLKSLTSGKVFENTFPAGHKIDDVRVERRKFQYLYNDESGYHFMDNETYDQVALNEAMLERPNLLKEGGEMEILFRAEKNIPLTAEMPPNIILEVTYTEPGVRGDTATNVTKPATVETGAEVKVPIFINQGDKIKIDTRTGSHIWIRVKA